MKSGMLYGVGVGPGDPELMTLKAVRIIRECDVIAVPQTKGEKTAALSIARQAVPQLYEKPILALPVVMTRDPERASKSRDLVAQLVTEQLAAGKNVAFLTLGDPSVYSTYFYTHQRVVSAGYSAQIIAGVPSFCAASAALGSGLVEGKDPLVVIPASYPDTKKLMDVPGTKVLMKTGRSFQTVKQMLSQFGLLSKAQMVQNCGMESEQIWKDLNDVSEDAPYFSVIIARERDE